MAGFYIPLSGLDADTTALNTIANNLSNMSTTGFKAQTTNFSTLFYQELSTNGSGDSIQTGTGVQVSSNSTDFTTGAIASTSVSTDAAIDGSGFFILDDNGSQLLTKAGDFQLSSTGNLESSAGLAVMGYAATNGTVSTSGGLTDLTVPVGTVMKPSATSTMSMTQNLDASAAVGSSTTGQVQVFDSLGNSYEATVTYTKTAANTWSYKIALPDTVQAAVSPTSNALTYDMSSPTSTVDPSTNLVITGPTAKTGVTASITAPAVSSGETLSSYAASLNTAIAAAGITGVTASATASGQLSIIGSGVTTTGKLIQDPITDVASATGTATNTKTFYFSSGSSTINPATNLTITGSTSVTGQTATTTAPVITAGESLSSYAAALSTAISSAGITGVTVTASSSGQLSITGAGVTLSGSVVQNPVSTVTPTNQTAADATTYYFSSANSTLDPTTNLVISGPTATAGTNASIIAPTVTAGESIGAYATALQGALTTAGIVGVNVAATATGQLTITGTGVSTTGSVVQATEQSVPNSTSSTAGTSTYAFSANALVSSTSGLSFTVPLAAADGGGTTAVTVTQTGTPETVADYAADMNTAFAAFAVANPNSGTMTATPVGNTITITSTGSAAGFTSTGSVYQIPESKVAATAVAAGTSSYILGSGMNVGADTNLSFTVPQAVADGGGNVTVTATLTGTPETVTDYIADLNTAFQAFAAANPNSGTMTAAPSASGNGLTITSTGTAAGYSVNAGSLNEVATATTQSGTAGNAVKLSYNLGSSSASIDPSTNLVITGPDSTGVDKVMTAPTITSGENLSTYASALQSAMTSAGIVGVSVTTTAAGQLTISGTNISTTGSLVESQVASLPTVQSTTYSFTNANSTVDPTTSLTITAPTASGATATILAPTVTSGETLTAYTTALKNALAAADITGVTVSSANGQLTITGANIATTGSLVQDPITTVANASATTGTATYNLASSTASLDPTTNLVIHGYDASGTAQTATVTPTSGESLSAYQTALTNAITLSGIQGVTVSSTLSGQLSIVGPSTTTFTGSLVQNQGAATLSGTTGVGNIFSYSLNSTSSTIDPATDLTITGTNSAGSSVTITAPSVSSGETLANYVASLNTALTAAGLNSSSSGSSAVSVTSTSGGQMTISGTNISVSGSVIADPSNYNVAANTGTISTISYTLASSSASIAPTTSLTITGPTAVAGVDATITAPTVVSGETLADYVSALNTALSNAGIVGASVTSSSTGTLNITGTGISTSGNLVQDQSSATLTASTGTSNAYSYNFASDNGVMATVNAGTNLTITGPTSTEGSATITAPTITAGETVAQYVADLNTAIGASGIVGATVSLSSSGTLSISGVNVTTSGNVIADPVSSSNTTGSLTFDADGNLSTPASNLTNITFGGLSDGASALNITWDLYSSTGTGSISQTSAASSTSATSQNGYTSGEYDSFTIGSSGLISATYSNGQTQNVGQIAIATVSNEEGMVAVGSTDYMTTAASGDASIGIAGEGGRGTIEGSSLEASNVNISTEFSDLIIAQRAFEANSKAITTFDTVTQDVMAIVR